MEAKGRITVSKCHFPGCNKEIKHGAFMCTRHGRMVHDAKIRKCNEGRSIDDLMRYASEHIGKNTTLADTRRHEEQSMKYPVSDIITQSIISKPCRQAQ